MAQKQFSGYPMVYGGLPYGATGTPAIATHTIAASTTKFAFCGRLFNKDGTSKNIHKIGFFPGAITSAGGTTLKISIQGISHTATPMQPDGTIGGAGNNGFVSQLFSAITANTWFQTAALGADVTVAFGAELSVVFEPTGFGGADSLVINDMTSNSRSSLCGSILDTAGTWAPANSIPNVILEFSDGTFGTLMGSWPFSNIGTVSYNTGTNPEVNALEFQLDTPMTVCGMWLIGNPTGATAAFEVDLYDGTSIMTNGAIVVDAHTVTDAASTRAMITAFPTAPTALSAAHTYRLALRPTTVNNVTLVYFDVANANHFQAHAGGTAWQFNTLHAGVWGTATATRRPFAGLLVCGTDDGASAGGLLATADFLGGFSQ